jgi:inorganic pyrophosphatase
MLVSPVGAAQGDNDPVDVVEIGEQQLEMGGVYAVKPLAVLAMIDDGELDWKIVAIRADDPRAAAVNDVEDVERRAPGRALSWGGCGRGGGGVERRVLLRGRLAGRQR